MKRLMFFFIAAALATGCSAQKSSFKNRIDNLKYVEDMPYFSSLSGDSIFWQVTADRKIIPWLIERVADTTQTNARVRYFGGTYTIGDACYFALIELMPDLRDVQLIKADQKEIDKKGAGVYWEYVRSSVENRQNFQKQIASWYELNRGRLVWVEDDKLYPIEDRENSKMRKRPAGGFYVLKENLKLYKEGG
jgi:hypothetical protein